MDRARRRVNIGPPSIVLGTALLVAAALPASQIGLAVRAAVGQPAAASACPPDSVGAAQAAQAALRPHGRGAASVQALLSARGELAGRLVSIQNEKGVATNVSLPPESFVGQPVGDAVLYTSYTTAGGSQVGLLDLASGCSARLATPTEIVRSALLDSAGSSVYVHSVSRVGRVDAGVQRFNLATGVTSPVVPPLPLSDIFGPTFATDLRWSLDGSALAVQSCGFAACRTRVLDTASGAIATYDTPGQGALIGLTNEHLVTFGACGGLPCPVVSIDLATGSAAVLAEATTSASIGPTADGLGTVTIETAAGIIEVVQ